MMFMCIFQKYLCNNSSIELIMIAILSIIARKDFVRPEMKVRMIIDIYFLKKREKTLK